VIDFEFTHRGRHVKSVEDVIEAVAVPVPGVLRRPYIDGSEAIVGWSGRVQDEPVDPGGGEDAADHGVVVPRCGDVVHDGEWRAVWTVRIHVCSVRASGLGSV
jgi:hypothetical protein